MDTKQFDDLENSLRVNWDDEFALFGDSGKLTRYNISGIGGFNVSRPPKAACLTASAPSVRSLRQQLTEPLRLRIRNIPKPPLEDDSRDNTRVAVLFSGDLDCSVLARLTHELLDDGYSIDLLNVAFENPRIGAQLKKEARGSPVNPYEAYPDRTTGWKSFESLQKSCPGRRVRFVAVRELSLQHQEVANGFGTGKCAIHGDIGASQGSGVSNLPPRHSDGPLDSRAAGGYALRLERLRPNTPHRPEFLCPG
ncbi:hypothetical protein QQS21_000627 [Conoideocrella luteorostrata]|uniref:Asparagine synthetase domain-containing protein n=1 Tax=Conoideocrella luteorostrata TaxID=1105319 RepID=A0AAJ0G2K6_9HYPO|nr:hypothetical protein QQS21_000627 [Conoideocrella luteorostrata]